MSTGSPETEPPSEKPEDFLATPFAPRGTPLVSAVRVQLGERSYEIEIGTHNLDALGERAESWCQLSHAVVITDEHVEKPHGQQAAESLANSGVSVDLLVVEAG